MFPTLGDILPHVDFENIYKTNAIPTDCPQEKTCQLISIFYRETRWTIESWYLFTAHFLFVFILRFLSFFVRNTISSKAVIVYFLINGFSTRKIQPIRSKNSKIFKRKDRFFPATFTQILKCHAYNAAKNTPMMDFKLSGTPTHLQ